MNPAEYKSEIMLARLQGRIEIAESAAAMMAELRKAVACVKNPADAEKAVNIISDVEQFFLDLTERSLSAGNNLHLAILPTEGGVS